MKLIHKHEEGDLIRNGLSYIASSWGLTDLILKLGRRAMFLFSGRDGFGWFIDLRRDHKMYRLNDADKPYLFCRRCGLSAYQAEDFCGGRLYRKWRQR